MLELLAKNHKLWIAMVRNMGCTESFCEDIVQEMYIRIDKYVKDGKRIMYNDEEVNRFFIYITLRNLYADYFKVKSKFETFEYNELDIENDDEYNEDDLFNILIDETDLIEEQLATDRLYNKIMEDVNTMEIFDIQLIHLSLKSGYSLRSIAQGSNIGVSSIYNSVKNCKKILREKFGEDVIDYFNRDYYLI